jgi:hypothetical protein
MRGAFASVSSAGVVTWRGAPSCQAGHDAVLAWLRENVARFLTAAEATNGGNILRGNLGESIAFCISLWHDCETYRVVAVNACRPLSPQSVQDIDIVWVNFAADVKDDFAIVQEVKTTSQPTLNYADQLLVDYDKLYGSNVDLTIKSRLKAIKKQLENLVGGEEGRALSKRLIALTRTNPGNSSHLKLRPTLVHELSNADSRPKMTAVRTALLGKGWDPDSVEGWGIGLTHLDARLQRLATGAA